MAIASTFFGRRKHYREGEIFYQRCISNPLRFGLELLGGNRPSSPLLAPPRPLVSATVLNIFLLHHFGNFVNSNYVYFYNICVALVYIHSPDRSLYYFVYHCFHQLFILILLSLHTKVHNVEFALELLQDAGLGKPKAKAQGMFTCWKVRVTNCYLPLKHQDSTSNFNLHLSLNLIGY